MQIKFYLPKADEQPYHYKWYIDFVMTKYILIVHMC